MYLEIFLADFAVFRVFLGISRDFAEIPEFRGSATAQNIRSPDFTKKYRTLLLSTSGLGCSKLGYPGLVRHLNSEVKVKKANSE